MEMRLPNEKVGIELAREFYKLFGRTVPYCLDLVCTLGGIQKAAWLDLRIQRIPRQQEEKIVSFLIEKGVPNKVVDGWLYVLAPQTPSPEKEFGKLEKALKLKRKKDWKSKEDSHRLLGEFFGIPKKAIEGFIEDQFVLSTASAIGPAFSLPQFRVNVFAGFHYNRETKDREVLEIIKKKEMFLKKYFPDLYTRWIAVQRFNDRDVYGRK